MAVRARFADDALAAAVEGGVTQLVVLGAGLDTYAYRGPLRHLLRIFDVDHPGTQDWKRRRLADAAIPLPGSLIFAPVDFEREALSDGLAVAGFEPAQRTFFTWLAVVPYLSEEVVWSTLRFIASLPNGAHCVSNCWLSMPNDLGGDWALSTRCSGWLSESCGLGGRNRSCSSPQKRWCVGIAPASACTGLGCRGLDTPPEGNP